MTNNYIIRRIRYIFDFDDSTMMQLFASAGYDATRAEISDWLKKDENPAFVACNDVSLATFLNGFINEKRGKREGPPAEPEKTLNNNMIFRKLKIALNYQDEDILNVLSSVNFKISKHELSAFFRKSTHKHYRECKDQVLRNFLKGLQKKQKPETVIDDKSPWAGFNQKLIQNAE